MIVPVLAGMEEESEMEWKEVLSAESFSLKTPRRRKRSLWTTTRICDAARFIVSLMCLGGFLKRIVLRGSVCLAVLVAVFGYLTPASGEAPSFSIAPYLQDVTESSIIICWESDVPSDGTIECWVEGTQNGSAMTVDSAPRHEVRLDNLEAGTAYRYRVKIPAEGEGTSFSAGFATAPTEEVPFTFVVYGDSRERDENDEGHRRVAEAARAVNPAFVVHTGDIVSRGDSDYLWNVFWGNAAPPDGEKSLAGNSPFYPVLGNHEYMSSEGGYKDEAIVSYQSYFVLPRNGLEGEHPEWTDRFYSFRYGPVFFIVLDVNNDSDPEYDMNAALTEGPPDIHPGSPQHEWLITQLAAAKAQYALTFVCLHQSPYSSGPWGESETYKMRFLDPLFRQYGVDAVLGSHDHFYERCETCVDDYRLLYFVEGAGGAPFYGRASGWDEPGSWMWDERNETYYTKTFDNSSHSFLRVDIEPLGNGAWRATFSATRPSGEVFDVSQIRRPWCQIGLAEALTFSFEAMPGQTYQIEYTDDLPGNEMAWQPLGAPIVADSPFIRIADDGVETSIPPTHDTVRHRFYRAYELP